MFQNHQPHRRSSSLLPQVCNWASRRADTILQVAHRRNRYGPLWWTPSTFLRMQEKRTTHYFTFPRRKENRNQTPPFKMPSTTPQPLSIVTDLFSIRRYRNRPHLLVQRRRLCRADSQEDNISGSNFRIIPSGILCFFDVAFRPEVSHICSCSFLREPGKILPGHADVRVLEYPVSVVQNHSKIAIVQWLRPHLSASLVVTCNDVPSHSEGVLVDCDDLRIHQNGTLLGAHLPHVSRNDKRGAPKAPETHLCARGCVVHRDGEESFQEIRVEPRVRSYEGGRLQGGNILDDISSALSNPSACNALRFRVVPEGDVIHLNAEHLTQLPPPFGDILVAPLTQGKQDRTTSCVQSP
mmetsp:Transcript_28348/g.39172  ORF Transcript_28348/g.39172 Transcript_28348/m.39172 type:complete len:353 (+) Transcript_28348:46-1104(+)